MKAKKKTWVRYKIPQNRLIKFDLCFFFYSSGFFSTFSHKTEIFTLVQSVMIAVYSYECGVLFCASKNTIDVYYYSLTMNY